MQTELTYIYIVKKHSYQKKSILFKNCHLSLCEDLMDLKL